MSLIYEPRGKAREYAPLACNVYRGCDHACVYCYAPSATRRTREQFARPELRAEDFLGALEREVRRGQWPPGTRVLLSFTTDPYCAFDAEVGVTRRVIEILHAGGLRVQVLTKGGTRALRDIDLFDAGDAFATTLTLLDPAESLRWEPGAALPEDRIEAIRRFHEAGIETWVSLEPVIDPTQSLELIRRTWRWVDLFKLGRLNYHSAGRAINWRAYGQTAIRLLESVGRPYFVKADLKRHLV